MIKKSVNKEFYTIFFSIIIISVFLLFVFKPIMQGKALSNIGAPTSTAICKTQECIDDGTTTKTCTTSTEYNCSTGYVHCNNQKQTCVFADASGHTSTEITWSGDVSCVREPIWGSWDTCLKCSRYRMARCSDPNFLIQARYSSSYTNPCNLQSASGEGGPTSVITEYNYTSCTQPTTSSTPTPAPAVACTESWTCLDWSACTDGTQTRTCTDSNSCGTTTSKPSTSQSCTIVQAVPLLATCTPDWDCGKWSTCINGVMNRTCIDQNECNIATDKPSTSRSCQVENTPTSYIPQAAPVLVKSCAEKWTCNEWSECSDGEETRTCTDANKCGTTKDKPLESFGCIQSEEDNTPAAAEEKTGPSMTTVIEWGVGALILVAIIAYLLGKYLPRGSKKT